MTDATPKGVEEQVTACYCWSPKCYIGGDMWEMGVLKYRCNWQEEETGVFLLPSHPSALRSHQCRFPSAGTALIHTLTYTINLLFPVPITCLNHINTPVMTDMIRLRRNRGDNFGNIEVFRKVKVVMFVMLR